MHGTLHIGSIKGKAPARRFRQDEIFDCAHQKADQKSNDPVNDAQNHPGNQKEVKFLCAHNIFPMLALLRLTFYNVVFHISNLKFINTNKRGAILFSP